MNHPEPFRLFRACVLLMAGTALLTLTGCNDSHPVDLIPTTKSVLALANVRGEKEKRLAWNLKTLLDPYRGSGRTNLIWNDAASKALIEFARERSGCIDTNEPSEWIIASNCASAAKFGCDDPMIRYLSLRNVPDASQVDPQTRAKQLWQAAFNLERSAYPNIRKYYAWTRAWVQLYAAYQKDANFPPEVRETMQPTALEDNLRLALQDKTMPVEEVYDACHESIVHWQGSKEEYDVYDGPLEKYRSDQAVTWLLKGEFYIAYAWSARGGGYATNVQEERWKPFRERLATAEDALETAWKLDPTDARIPVAMITLAEAQEKDRDTMELWFSRAMALDPDNYDACENKLHYLYPQWYGSREAMIEFGRECVSSNWGGEVPLVLSDAHWQYQENLDDPEEKRDYWKRRDVWPDIKLSFDRFFELNPDATGRYHNYAWYAYQCGQWDVFNDTIPKLGQTNYAYFGGKDYFDEMVRNAREQAANPQKPSPAQNQ